MKKFVLFSKTIFSILCIATVAAAQDPVAICLEPETVYEKRPVTVTKYVDETVMEKHTQTSWKPVWQTEQREKRTTVLKPVQKTSEREERYTVLRPVTETKYRERTVQETSYEDVTEMREERTTVLKPVIETEMREQQYTVRREITEQQMQTENVTQYKPVTVNQTQLTPGHVAVPQTTYESFRPQLKWLAPGFYTDPQTGVATWRRRGLHWTQQPSIAATHTSYMPALVPQTVPVTTLVPEVVQCSKPVTVTRYEDRIETRKVPVEVEKMVEHIEVRKVPVTVRVPKTTTRVERIPYQETEYREETVVKKVPVTETTYQEVEQVEPYEVETCKWVQYDQEVEIPKVVRKKVEETSFRIVPKTVMRKVAVDAWGNRIPISQRSEVDAADSVPALSGDTSKRIDSSATSSGFGTTQRSQKPTVSVLEDESDDEPSPTPATLLETSERQLNQDQRIELAGINNQRIDYSDRPVIRETASRHQAVDATTIVVPPTRPSLDRPRTRLTRIEQPRRVESAAPEQEDRQQIETTLRIPSADLPDARWRFYDDRN